MQYCPQCDCKIEAKDMNIQEGFALCPGCSELFRLAELEQSESDPTELLGKTPSGCSVDDLGREVVITASLRSYVGFIGPLMFGLFWNSITSIFVMIDLAGYWANLVGPLPAWFPFPGLKNGIPEMNDRPMTLGDSIFLSLFLIPFVSIGAGMFIAALMGLAGSVRVVISQFDSYVSTGVWFLRWKNRFDSQQVTEVKTGEPLVRSNTSDNKHIEIHADRVVKLGSMLTDVRRQWLRVVLRKYLLKD